MTIAEVRDKTAQLMGTACQCAVCGRPQTPETLSNFGTRCYPCYQAYCREEPRWPVVPKVPDGPLAWAHRLKARQQAGEVLTATQREMMNAALRRQSDHTEGDE